MPTIICPKHTCGCGLCAPKSIDKSKYVEVMKRHVDMTVFENSMNEVPKKQPIWIRHE